MVTPGDERAGTRADQQLRAVKAWQAHAAVVLDLAQRMPDSREARMDAQRRLAALKRAQAALQHRAEVVARRSHEALDTGAPTALLVHRIEWMRGKLAARLGELGIQVLAEADDGADGLGLTIAEQPELLVVEDRLPSITAPELIREVREYSPRTLVAAQVEHDDEIGALLDAGAAAVFSRRVPPQVLADEVEALLRDPRLRPVVVA